MYLSVRWLILLLILALITGCAYNAEHNSRKSMPGEAFIWLLPGEQSLPHPENIAEIKAKVATKGKNQFELTKDLLSYVRQSFSYDPWYNELMFKRSFNALYESKTLGGCADFALIDVALFRIFHIPARIVLTINQKWYKHNKFNENSIPHGHTFVEVYLDNQWYLIDSSYFILFKKQAVDCQSYPRGEFFLLRGTDFWDMDIKSNADLWKIINSRQIDLAKIKSKCSFEPIFRVFKDHIVHF